MRKNVKGEQKIYTKLRKKLSGQKDEEYLIQRNLSLFQLVLLRRSKQGAKGLVQTNLTKNWTKS